MIKQVDGVAEILRDDSYYSRKIRAHHRAYGGSYDFMRFYEVDDGAVGIFNSHMTVSVGENSDYEELSRFIALNSPYEIELPLSAAEKIPHDDYDEVERTLFRFVSGEYDDSEEVNENPKLDDVFGIIADSFNLRECYDMWLTDTSHRIRHGVSQVFLMGKTTATMHFCENGTAFFGQIATAPEERGKGKARQLLYRLAARYERAELFAKNERVSFYSGIGFIPVYKDKLLVRK
ncbi:MAG: hypothetical protein E7507_04545 [Ruminococcus sp.]|nr:hypothetical protein [Ruminococcus sp.]